MDRENEAVQIDSNVRAFDDYLDGQRLRVATCCYDYRQSGDDHFYSLEYDQAIADYTKLIQQNPTDPISYNDLASAQLYKEMYRLGLLDSTAVMRDNRFLRDLRPQADWERQTTGSRHAGARPSLR